MKKSPFASAKQKSTTGEAEGSFELSRRRFLQVLAEIPAIGLISHSAFAKPSNSLQSVPQALSEPWLSIDAVQKQMFPKSINWLSAEQINALPYLQQKMQRPLANNSDYEFLQQGVGWLNDFAQSEFKSFFVELDSGQKESLLRKIAQSRAGQNWLGMILNNLIEALLGDPVYGGNPNGIGWKAMGQTPGYPLPAKEERYYELGYQRRQRDYQKRIVRNTKG